LELSATFSPLGSVFETRCIQVAKAEWDVGKKMKLIELVRDLDALDKRGTIYASQPWSEASEAIVAYEPEAGGMPAEAEHLQLKYFLEVFIARDFIEGWIANCRTPPTLEQKCAGLIEYAANDA
jgi:hypothetical protein